MGGQQSTTGGTKVGDNCHPCFAFHAPFQQSQPSDPLGSPLPDTPVTKRKQRGIHDLTPPNGQNGRSDPVYSSRYGGLEKEPDSSSNSKRMTSNGDEEYEAKIHEGPVSAMRGD